VVSVGNAGQLAVDMLLASLVPGGVPRVGFLDCPFVLPIAGHDAFASSPPAPQRKKKKGKKKGSAGAPSVLSVNVEGARDPHPTRSAPDGASPGGWRAVFLDKARGLTILQMRAPVAPVRQPHRRCGLAWPWLGRALASPPALAGAGPAPRALRDACRLDPGTSPPALHFCARVFAVALTVVAGRQASGFRSVVALSTLPAYTRRDAQLSAPELMRGTQLHTIRG